MKTMLALSLVAAIGAGAALPTVAEALPIKPGLWKVDVQDGAGQTQNMPAMSQMSPAAQARMKAKGIHMGASGMTVFSCITPEQVAKDTLEIPNGQNCKTENTKINSKTYSADIVCTGRLNIRGHIEAKFLSPVHYTAHETVNTMVNGRAMSSSTDIDANWVSADCGKYKRK